MYALQRLLYGPLRPIEMEQLSEKAWYAVLDTLLAMPTYREDVGGWLLTMFVLLLAGKVWGWIGEGRVDILEQQPPANPRLFHARLSSSLVVSVLFDIWMLHFCVESVIADPRPGIMVIFTFEFAILAVCSLFTLSRYMLSVFEAGVVKKQTQLAIELRKSEIRAERAAEAAAAETQNDASTAGAETRAEEPIEVDENEVNVPGWEEKRRYLFGLELMTDFIKLTIYITFFVISITFNGLPMHILRDVYMTFASFSKRVGDFIAYRKATSEMNTRYPDATTEEIREDSCIICRENMVAWEQPDSQAEPQPAGQQAAAAPPPARQRDEGLRAKKLPCGHILHLRCLKAWLERQQVCPTCRRPVVSTTAPAGAAGGAGNAQHGQGGQPGQAGQAGQPPAPRAPRGRMFNLGPLRVALLNAPNEQMRNILNEIENPNGAANQNAPAGANNHQGAVPAAAGGQPVFGAAPGRRAAVPLNIQLMQVEQRIMQEAYNLNIEQQQLAHLRAMEAELARLRAQLIPAQQPVGTHGAPRQGVVHMPDMPVGFGMAPLHEQLTGNPMQQYGVGHEHLPEGVTIPEGWSVMPLRRAGTIQDGSTALPTQAMSVPAPVGSEAPISAPRNTVAEGNPGPSNETPPANSAVAAGNAGPTDEQGSPLFIAADAAPTSTETSVPTATTANAAETIQLQPVDAAPAAAPASQPESTASASSSAAQALAHAQNENQAPWSADEGSWSFDEEARSNQAPEVPAAPEAQEEGSSRQPVPKEVQVEEVPDAGT